MAGGGGRTFRGANVVLNVYDLWQANSYTHEFGVGAFHSGVEILGTEYTFGGHETSSTGIFSHAPRQAPGAAFRAAIDMGETDKSSSDIRAELSSLGDHFRGNSYHLVLKNCNHFSNELCLRLTGRPIPSWVNRLAYMGSWVSCMLPKNLGVHHPDAADVQSQGISLATIGQATMVNETSHAEAADDASERRALLAEAALKRFGDRDDADT